MKGEGRGGGQRGASRSALGRPAPLGAHWNGVGVNFAVSSRHARAVTLCLFDRREDHLSSAELPMHPGPGFVWHLEVPGLRPGQLYGYRADGDFDPGRGQRFNPRKLLVDPYARALSGTLVWNGALSGGRRPGHGVGEGGPDPRDSAPYVPKSLVVDPGFPWDEDRPPDTPWERTVLYECHVAGLTRRHPDVPEPLRGTYLGLASEPVIDHLVSLGVTAVELLPVQHAVSERALVERGLRNYWGYNTLGFFAPDPRFATGDLGEQVREFKTMVKILHRAGLEVILDVVYNHTPEGNHLGPTLALRGLDNATYYHLDPADPSRYRDFSGCGNTPNTAAPRVRQLVLDSLRYWVSEMHVDGFRFDLAPALARDATGLSRLESFFTTIQQDPVLGRVKLVAEPWDVGPHGYQVGGFPPGFAEWNGRYRDCVRRFWRGDPGQLGELAARLAGSADLFGAGGRTPLESVNFVTAHDGFTLRDLVSYESKHNEANGEEGRDGENANWSQNCGVEGTTERVSVQRRRLQLMKNLLATLAFSQGVPMLSHGDELGRTQGGNNNAYCQDNETAWVDWDLDSEARELRDLTRRVLALRREHPVLRRSRFFVDGENGDGDREIRWLRPDGEDMGVGDWQDPEARALGVLLPGSASDARDDRGRPLPARTLLALFNASSRPVLFRLPGSPEGVRWEPLLFTARHSLRRLRAPSLRMPALSVALLAREAP